MKITKTQQAVLDAIKAHGYIHSIAWHCSRTTSVPGYPHKITDATIKALRSARKIESKVIRPKGEYPDGTINRYKVSSIIYVPALDPGSYVEIIETATSKLVKRMGPMSEHEAEKVERGVLINMNHDAYHTGIRQVK